MKIFVTIILGCIATIGYSQKLDTLLYNGNSAGRIDFVILGDGYRESELPKFLLDAIATTNALFQQRPFKEYKNYFNVFSIQTASVESGAARSPDELIDNYYGSTFGYAGIDRLLVPTKNSTIFQVLAENFPLYDHILMLVNDSKYGGSGGVIATASTDPSSFEVMVHELGHSFGGLSDEYWAGPQYAGEKPNMTKEKDAKKVRWKNWIGDLGIGVYPYPEDKTWQRPHQNCRMQFLGVPFCAVCIEQIIYKIHAFAPSIDSHTPVEDAIHPSNEFSLSLLKPTPNTLKIKWSLNDGVLPVNNTAFMLNEDELASLPDTLEAEVIDTTTLSRRDLIFASRVKWILYSDITSERSHDQIPRIILSPVTGVAQEQLSTTSVYPNPYTDKLFIEYVVDYPQEIRIRVLDFNGQEIGEDAFFQIPGKHKVEPNMRAFKNGIVMLYTNNKWESFKVLRK